MKILWICGSPVLGGAERATLRIAAELRARGHQTAVCCPDASPLARAARASGLAVDPANGGWRPPSAWVAISRALRRKRPDITWATAATEWVPVCLSVSHRLGTAVVLARHMTLPISPPVRWLARRRADAVVAVSEAVRRSLRGIPPRLISVIPVPPRFPPRARVPTATERAQARAALRLDPTGHWVAFCGGLNPAKGIEDVLHAVGEVNRRTLTRVVICGLKGHERALGQLPGWIGRFGLAGRVSYLGEVERVDTVMTAADAVLLATHRSLGEAMPLTVLEAMACGTPVVAYAVGGTPEALGADGEAGRLARCDDPESLAERLAAVLEEPDAAAAMAARALGRVREQFAPERIADQYERLFRRIGGPEHN